MNLCFILNKKFLIIIIIYDHVKIIVCNFVLFKSEAFNKAYKIIRWELVKM